jgi:hypothetical protein
VTAIRRFVGAIVLAPIVEASEVQPSRARAPPHANASTEGRIMQTKSRFTALQQLRRVLVIAGLRRKLASILVAVIAIVGARSVFAGAATSHPAPPGVVVHFDSERNVVEFESSGLPTNQAVSVTIRNLGTRESVDCGPYGTGPGGGVRASCALTKDGSVDGPITVTVLADGTVLARGTTMDLSKAFPWNKVNKWLAVGLFILAFAILAGW